MEGIKRGFHDRLAELIGNEKPFVWAERMGISKGAFSRIWNKGTLPSPELLGRIKTGATVSIDWLLFGEGQRNVTDGDTIMIPHLDVRVSAGDGELIQTEEEKGKFPFDRNYFKRALKIDPRHAVMVDVVGDSMLPTFAPGDPVMVDIAQPQSIVDGVWVVRIDDATLVKRIQHLPGGTLRVTSDNPSYEPFTFDMKEEQPDFALIGRVVWAPRKY